MAAIKLIVGLGNPGREYSQTRHNIGFRAVESFSVRLEGKWKNWHGKADIFESSDAFRVKIAKPLLYMNNSGEPVKQIAGFYKILPEEMLVVLDDFALPLGTIRLRLSGSDGGHNGLTSIINSINSSRFPRLRLGIGPIPEKVDPADFVLSKFANSEKEQVEKMLERADETINNTLQFDIEKAASRIKNEK